MNSNWKGASIIIALVVFFLLFAAFFQAFVPKWKGQISAFAEAVQTADGVNELKIALQKADDLPPVYPIGQVRKAAMAGRDALTAIDAIESVSLQDGPLSRMQLLGLLDQVDVLKKSAKRARRAISNVPHIFLTEEQKSKKSTVLEVLKIGENAIDELAQMKGAVLEHFAEEARVLVLFQNQNEVRPTGGFVGSMLIIDFEDTQVTGRFVDVYALDRQVEDTLKLPAPEWFFPLSKEISLRDANLTRDFPDAARVYRYFFSGIGEVPPDTVLAINLSIVSEVMQRTGNIRLEEWGMNMTAENFDLLLSFLVESKAAGRFSAKEPVLDVANALMKSISEYDFNAADWADFDAKAYMKNGNVLLDSQLSKTAALSEQWNTEGALKWDADTTDFFGVDFVSIGANKSDRFVWSRIAHDTNISPSGVAKNTITIRRTHAIREGELSSLLGVENWPQNLRGLLDQQTNWKLGLGENRAVVRLYVPVEAQFIAGESPTGAILNNLSVDGKFRVFTVPMNVKPQESAVAQLEYTIPLDKGSSAWRGYSLQFAPPLGVQQATFLKYISTASEAQSLQQTQNVGLPVPFSPMIFRAVASFEEELNN